MSRSRRTIPAALLALSFLALAPVSPAAAQQFLVTNGTVFFFSDPGLPPREAPDFVLMFPIPATIDTASEAQEVFCALNTENIDGEERTGVKGVKARWTSTLYLLDLATSRVTTTKLEQGRVKTNREGRGEFLFDIPTALFADGFESGDVFAFSLVTFDLQKGRSTMDSRAECFAVDEL